MWQTHQETVIFAGLNSATSIEYVQLGYGSSLCLPRGTRCRVVSKFEPLERPVKVVSYHRAAGKICQMFSPNNPNTWSAQVSSLCSRFKGFRCLKRSCHEGLQFLPSLLVLFLHAELPWEHARPQLHRSSPANTRQKKNTKPLGDPIEIKNYRYMHIYK